MKKNRALFYTLVALLSVVYVFALSYAIMGFAGWLFDQAIPLAALLCVLLVLLFIPFKKKLLHIITFIIEGLILGVLILAIVMSGNGDVARFIDKIIVPGVPFIALLVIYIKGKFTLEGAYPGDPKKEKKVKEVKKVEKPVVEVTVAEEAPVVNETAIEESETISVESNENSEKLSAWQLFLFGLKTAINYLFKSKQIIKHFIYMIVSYFAALVGVLAPFVGVSAINVYKKICNGEKVDYLSSFKGVSSIERYGRFYLSGLLAAAVITGKFMAALVPVICLFLLCSVSVELMIIVLVIGSIFASVVATICALDYTGITYLYANHDTESVNYLVASKELMNGKKKRLIIFSIISGLIYSLAISVPSLIFMGIYANTYSLFWLGLTVLVVFAELSVMSVGMNTAIYKLLSE